nr:methyltransferase [Rhizomicrobium palustre]
MPLFAIYALWVMWFFAWLVATLVPLNAPRKLNAPEDFLYRLAVIAATLLLFTITPWPGLDVQYRLWEQTLDDDIAWRLVAVAAGAMLLAAWALAYRIFVLRRGAELVTTGPYALLRHPAYFCLMVSAFATAILFGRPSGFMGASLLSVCFVVKTLVEEARSASPAFRAYRSRSFMYLPLVGLIIYAVMRFVKRPAAPARAQAGLHEDEPPLRVAPLPLELFLDDADDAAIRETRQPPRPSQAAALSLE